jgi:hypothetical protein
MGNPRHPLEGFLPVITVSLKTMKIVKGLPLLGDLSAVFLDELPATLCCLDLELMDACQPAIFKLKSGSIRAVGPCVSERVGADQGSGIPVSKVGLIGDRLEGPLGRLRFASLKAIFAHDCNDLLLAHAKLQLGKLSSSGLSLSSGFSSCALLAEVPSSLDDDAQAASIRTLNVSRERRIALGFNLSSDGIIDVEGG